MTVNAATGVKLFIGAVQTAKTPVLADYTGDTTYVEVGEIETLGNFGDKSSSISFTALSDARTRKLKGPRDAGDFAVTTGDDPNDPGQIAMDTAEATPFDYNFYVQKNDQLTLAGHPSKAYFHGKVMSNEDQVGSATAVVKRGFSVAINSPIIKTLPS